MGEQRFVDLTVLHESGRFRRIVSVLSEVHVSNWWICSSNRVSKKRIAGTAGLRRSSHGAFEFAPNQRWRLRQ
jgi:hypothetical protein